MRRFVLSILFSWSPWIVLASGPGDPAPAKPSPSIGVASAAAQDSAATAERLEALAHLFRVPAPSLPEALMPHAGDACAIELVSVAVLYRNDPDKWRNRFFGLLVIDDYVARSKKQYNLVGSEQIRDIVNDAFGANPGVTDERMKSAVAFCEIMRTQPFVMTREAGMVALSRVVRGIMLGELLEGVDEDALGIANAIDAHTYSLHPGLEMPWERPPDDTE
jgi:hypothetical protein